MNDRKDFKKDKNTVIREHVLTYQPPAVCIGKHVLTYQPFAVCAREVFT
jgi:hypothetical protein